MKKLGLLRSLLLAHKAQAKAVYPGCVQGFDHCLSQSCGCNEGCPSPAFITARAARIREKGEDAK